MTYITNKVSGQTGLLNTTETPLGIGATFTGVAELNDYPSVMISTATDKNGTLFIEFSQDGTNWDTSLSFVYDTSRINPPHVFEKGNRYFRVRFENTSGEVQTYLRLITTYNAFSNLTAPINGTLAENYDATVVRPTDYKYEVAMGKRQGRSTVSKFGYNTDIDNSTPEIIGSFGGSFDPSVDIMTTSQTFTVTYNNATDGLGTTGATQLLVDYLDVNFELQQGVHVLGNTGSDVTSFSGLGINRIVVFANGGDLHNNNNITFTATTDTTIQAMIPAEVSVTQQCIFHVPINHTLLIDYLRVSALKISGGGGSPRVEFLGYSYSRFTNTAYKVIDLQIDTSVENNLDFAPSQPTTFSGRDVIYVLAKTDVNNTSVTARFSGILERVK